MPHKLRKIRKKRGTRTQGYGRVSQHRGIGQRGGHGKTGRHKHKWSYIQRYEPDYFKKSGFTSPKSLGRESDTINVGELEELAQEITRRKRTRRKTAAVIDLKELGYNKLLGKGKIAIPIHVKVASCSHRAAKKIEAASGQVLVET